MPRSSTTVPYPRRSPAHPKSSRQQFSACGACRMRRVRCDLKDLPSDATGPPNTCSNCKERGLKCVDEFADVKTVKLLRRGRRLQQVEAIYGKASTTGLASPSYPPRSTCIIPQLQPEFFLSSFWRRLGVQRPIIDPTEFPARFNAHHNGTHTLSPEGRLIAMLLVVWAFSFGVDERGVEHPDGDQDPANSVQVPQDNEPTHHDGRRRKRKERTNAMVREVLRLVDNYSIMRKPSWDGARVLLLLLPLMKDAQLPLEILTMYETALAQVHGLASLVALAPPLSHNSMDDALVKARIFWYSYVHEGLTTGLCGGRLMLDEVDLGSFQETLHSQQLQQPAQLSAAHQSYRITAQLFSVPLRLSGICRKVHALLTGRDARRRAERGLPIDSDGVQEIWAGLDACWDEFDAIRRSAIGMAVEEVEQYVGGWQIFTFECQNIVRDALKQYIISQSPPGGSSHNGFPSHPTPPPSSATSVHRLHTLAVRRCMKLLPLVLQIIKMHLQVPGTPLFQWDTGLVGDGCFFAGFLAAGGENDHTAVTPDASAFVNRAFKQEDTEAVLGHRDGVELCLLALREMRWSFAKAEEREQTIRMVCNARRADTRHTLASDFVQHEYLHLEGGYNSYESHGLARPPQQTIVPFALERPLLPPLNVTLSPPETLIVTPATMSSPHTAGTDSSSTWPNYTPPGTGTSGSGSTTFSRATDSPVYSTLSAAQLQVYAKGDLAAGGDVLNPTHAGIVDVDPFSFSVPVSGYHQHQGHHEQGDGCDWRLSGQCRCF